MNQVLRLQDNGDFGKVGPFMKRIEELQSEIESGHKPSPKNEKLETPPPVYYAPVEIKSDFNQVEKKSSKETESSPVPTKGLQVPAKGSPIPTKVLSSIKKSSGNQATQVSINVSMMQSDEDTSSSSSSSEEETAAVVNKPNRRERRRSSLGNKHDSDVLLLVGPAEEIEIIKTLGGSPIKKSTRNLQHSNRHMNSSQEGVKRDRVMLSKTGWMFKAPPDHKRFSRWRRREFTLAGSLLSYKVKGSTFRIIPLKGAHCEAVSMDKHKKHSKGNFEVRIGVVNSSRIYRLRVTTKVEALEWQVALMNNIAVANREGDISSAEKRRKTKSSKSNDAASWAEKPLHKIGDDVTKVTGEEDIDTLYKVLNVQPSSSGSIIKKKYHELARNYHPDKNKDIDVSKFAQVAHAFETLQSIDTRKPYDISQSVKKKLRQGIILTMHEVDVRPYQVVLMADSEFKNLYWQDPSEGSVLQPGFKYVQLRWIAEIVAGSDGFNCPPGRADCCLTFRGKRLGCTLGIVNREYSMNLELDVKQARDDILDGLRVFRCASSELFKQRLDEMWAMGLR